MGSYEQVVHATTYFSDVEFIEWASKYELIPDIHQIRICNRCAKLMYIHFHANLPDGAVWRCSDYYYSNTLSIRIDSWTKDSKLPLKTLARLVGCWCAGRTVQTASVDCSISKFTVTKYYQEFRQVAEALYRKDISSNPLGNTITKEKLFIMIKHGFLVLLMMQQIELQSKNVNQERKKI